MSTLIKDRLESKANSMTLSSDGFQEVSAGGTLVMGTPGFTVTIATYALISSIFITTTQTGGPERGLSKERLESAEGASLSELLGLHEAD